MATQSIILAAGLGSRLKEITKVTPKSLIEINEEAILERHIKFIIEAGIKKIVIVIGYKSEKFLYLKEKFKDANIEFVINHRYSEFNTLYSLNLVSDHLTDDTYISTADIYLMENVYKKYEEKNHSFYLLRKNEEKFEKCEWTAVVDENNKILEVNTTSYIGNTYTGISFWKKNELDRIKAKMTDVNWNDKSIVKSYWDELLLDELGRIDLYAKFLDDTKEIFEIDDMEDLNILKREVSKIDKI